MTKLVIKHHYKNYRIINSDVSALSNKNDKFL
jgi:hypothetical protein